MLLYITSDMYPVYMSADTTREKGNVLLIAAEDGLFNVAVKPGQRLYFSGLKPGSIVIKINESMKNDGCLLTENSFILPEVTHNKDSYVCAVSIHIARTA